MDEATLWLIKGWDAAKAKELRLPPESVPKDRLNDWLDGWDEYQESISKVK